MHFWWAQFFHRQLKQQLCGQRTVAWVSGAVAPLPVEASDEVSFPRLAWRKVLSPRRDWGGGLVWILTKISMVPCHGEKFSVTPFRWSDYSWKSGRIWLRDIGYFESSPKLVSPTNISSKKLQLISWTNTHTHTHTHATTSTFTQSLLKLFSKKYSFSVALHCSAQL